MTMEPPPPPPPPPPRAESVAVGGEPVNIGDAVSYGWNVYWKNVGPMVVIAIVDLRDQVSCSSAIGNAFGFVAAPDRVAVRRVAGRAVPRHWAGSGSRSRSPAARGRKSATCSKREGYGPYIVASIVFGIGFFIGLLLFIVPGIIFAVVFGFYGFVSRRAR